MKIIIAGGSGFIGHALSQDLAARGDEVWVLTRDPAGRTLPAGVHAAQWDGKTAQGWGHLAGRADAIINLAGANIGALPWTNERKRLLRESRANAGQAIMDAIRHAEHRPSVVLQIAGVGYYGIHGDEPLDENAPGGHDYLSQVAADWEAAIRPVSDLGVRLVIMRTGVVLARKGGVLAPFVLQNQLFSGGPLGSGRQWISWIHIADLIAAFHFLLERSDVHGVVNVTSPEPVANADFGRAVSKAMHRPFWFPVPAFLLRLVLGEMSTLILDGQRVVPRRLEQLGFSFTFGSLEKALNDLLG